VKGVHAYMGTRFLNHEDVVENTRRILATAEDLAGQLGFPLETVDFGGGLGVAYFENEEDLDLDALGAGLAEVITPFSVRNPDCRMIMELGRFLTADDADNHTIKPIEDSTFLCIFTPALTGREDHDENGVYPLLTDEVVEAK
jgi:arginine decarboxylase-like protein